ERWRGKRLGRLLARRHRRPAVHSWRCAGLPRCAGLRAREWLDQRAGSRGRRPPRSATTRFSAAAAYLSTVSRSRTVVRRSGRPSIAAIAALVTISYARATVSEARAGRREAREGGAALFAEQRAAIDEAARPHRDEMAQRARALQSELALQRAIQLQTIATRLR